MSVEYTQNNRNMQKKQKSLTRWDCRTARQPYSLVVYKCRTALGAWLGLEVIILPLR